MSTALQYLSRALEAPQLVGLPPGVEIDHLHGGAGTGAGAGGSGGAGAGGSGGS